MKTSCGQPGVDDEGCEADWGTDCSFEGECEMKTRNDTEYGKVEIGPSDVYKSPKPKRGYAVWIENGVWFTAPKVSPRKFGQHAYAGKAFDFGIRDCPCGCYMLSASSAGPCDPFGACPKNPKQ